MHTRTLLNVVLLFVALLLLLAVFLVNQHESKPPETLSGALQQSQLTSIHIKRPGKIIKLEKIDGIWQMLSPYAIAANDVQVDKMMRLLNIVSVSSFLAENRDLALYGLDNSAIKVKLNDSVFLLGSTEPINDRRYVMTGTQIHLTDRDVRYLFEQPVENYISNGLFPADTSISAIHLPLGALDKQENGQWLKKGNMSSLSADEVVEVVNEWSYAQALRVSPYQNQPGTEISIVTPDQRLDFIFQQLHREYTLARAELGIQYHLSKETAEKLGLIKKPQVQQVPPLPQ